MKLYFILNAFIFIIAIRGAYRRGVADGNVILYLAMVIWSLKLLHEVW